MPKAIKSKGLRFTKTIVLGGFKTLAMSALLYVFVDRMHMFSAWLANIMFGAVVIIIAFLVQDHWIYGMKHK
ncbi:MAG: hypothetical protein ABIH41_06160 [Nanoarchaeota archaeon]